jgi:hypothetical protein
MSLRRGEAGVDAGMTSIIATRLAGIVLAAGIATCAGAGEFQYSIPAGWRDVLKSSQDASGIPQRMLTEAATGRFAVYAVDPSNTTPDKPGSTFNAVETPGPVGRITDMGLDSYSAELVAQIRAAGLKAGLVDVNVVSMNGVDVGMVTIDTDTEDGGNRRLLQFLFSGKKSGTVLTYAAPKDQFAQYLPVFRASARATQGGYAASSFNWRQTLAVGAFAAFVGLVIALLRKFLAGTKGGEALEEAIKAATGRPATPAAPAPLPAKKVSYVWTCPGCGKPVPLRIDQCRCGTAKPA